MINCRHFCASMTSFLLALIFQTHVFAFSAPKTSFLNALEPLENAKFIITPNDGHEELVKAFQNAKKSIQVGIFGITDKSVAEGLSQAQKRGVPVTIICDKQCESTAGRKALLDQLRADGVTVYMASTAFTISHWKMFVVDETLAFISTMNFISRHAEMRDMGVFITNPNVVKEILSVFKEDIINSKDNTKNTPDLHQTNLVWSPVNSEQKLVQLIESADQTIDIWIENMGSFAINDALAAAVQRKVQVRVLTSLCGMGTPADISYPILKKLTNSGVKVQGMPYPATTDSPYIHAKTMNVDHQVLFVGSENFSRNSLQSARELGLIFKDTSIQNKMANIFESDWSHSGPFPDVAPTTCESLTAPRFFNF